MSILPRALSVLLALTGLVGCALAPGGAVLPRMQTGLLAPSAPAPALVSPAPEPARRDASLPRADAPAEGWRAQVVSRARALVGQNLGGGSGGGVVVELLRRAYGRRLPEGAMRGDGLALRKAGPQPGDLVVFALGGDAARAEERSEVGIVLDVQGSRVSFAYVMGAWVRRGWLNQRRPGLRRVGASGRVENTFLRPRLPTDRPGRRYLAGELLSGFASL